MEIQETTAAEPCVLLVDDDSDHRIIFRSFLEHHGWRVTEADAAASAFAVLGENDVGVVVVDLGGTDGWSLLEALGPRAQRPRLLCLTGDARPLSRDRATRLGADGYLTKPINLARLGDAVAQLGGSSAAVRRERPRPAAREAAPALREPRPLVLLMEDDEDARSIYRDMLGFAGFEVVAACDGIEGLRYAEARRPDVVVTDLHMPGLNGIEVAKTLRASEQPTPPLIAVTADSLGIRAAEPRDGDPPLFDEVLVKPVTPGELVRRVRLYVSPSEDNAA